MSLLLPIALLGLVILPLIVLLHLLRYRREPLTISSLRLWRGLDQKRRGVSPRKLRISLMLLMQLLIAAALVFGLAQPVFSFLMSRPQQTIFLLDNTTSMAAEDAAGSHFEAARETIRQRLQTMSENDSFAIIGLNHYPQVLAAGNGEDTLPGLQMLDSLQPGATGTNLSAALTLANGLIHAEQRNQIVVLSDNAYTFEADDLPHVLAPVDWQMFGSATPLANQALVNVSARKLTDGRQKLFARIVNYSNEPVQRTVRLVVDGQNSGETAVQLGPRADTARVWTLANTAQTATVEIVEADGLPLDNRADLLLANTTDYQLLLLAADTQIEAEAAEDETKDNVLARALEAQPGVELTVGDLADLGGYDFTSFDLIVLDGVPEDQVDWSQSNLLLINPPSDNSFLAVGDDIRNLRPDVKTASALLTEIDWSGVYFDRLPQVTLPEWARTDLMAVPAAAENGLSGQPLAEYPLIFHGTLDDNQVMVWTFDLAESNLSGRLALPLLMDNTLSALLSTSIPAVVSVGEPVAIEAGLTVELPDGTRYEQPFQIDLNQTNQFVQTQQAGLYKIYNQQDKQIGGFATHTGSSLESNLAPEFDPALLVALDAGVGEAPPEIENDEYWPWLAGLALVVITIEGWLAWRR